VSQFAERLALAMNEVATRIKFFLQINGMEHTL
jgi:hypothetical protein